jgi:hypothetical protein
MIYVWFLPSKNIPTSSAPRKKILCKNNVILAMTMKTLHIVDYDLPYHMVSHPEDNNLEGDFSSLVCSM